jgi:hypothetical protein
MMDTKSLETAGDKLNNSNSGCLVTDFSIVLFAAYRTLLLLYRMKAVKTQAANRITFEVKSRPELTVKITESYNPSVTLFVGTVCLHGKLTRKNKVSGCQE